MLYPQYFIDDLKNRADLVRIIQPYAAGSEEERGELDGVLSVSSGKDAFVFGEPVKGVLQMFRLRQRRDGVYNFLMEMEGLNFPEAIKRVAEISRRDAARAGR